MVALVAAALAADACASVTPLVEAIGMNGSGDVADDMAVWLHPTDRTKSIIIGANKSEDANGGLYTFGLGGGYSAGASWQTGVNWFDNGKKLSNVDVRYNFRAGTETWDLVAASNRTDHTIDVFRVVTGAGGAFAGLTAVGSITPSNLGGDYPYGVTLFHSKSQNEHFVIATDKDGKAEQFRLAYNPATGKVQGTSVWHADVGGNGVEVEGIVADDEKDVVYIAAEHTSLYRYATSAGVIQSAGRVIVDSVGAHLAADIEGLAIYYASDGTGYLTATSQGDSRFAVYAREFAAGAANAYVMNFDIGANPGLGIDAVTGTDGIDVVNVNLGGAFTSGMFLAHDADGNDPSNFKFAAWSDVAGQVSPNLTIDTTWDPRSVPEPGTLALTAVAVLAALARRRFRALPGPRS